MSYGLEHQGVDTANQLWTATALVNNLPAVYRTHMDYFKAGAQLVITDTYQANVDAFVKDGYSTADALQFIRNGVKIAQQARDDYEQATGIHNFVAGTVGPYGAYLADGNEYRGEYDLSDDAYLNFHLPRLTAILDEQPDCLAIETQPKLDEVLVLLNYLQKTQPTLPVYVSFTLHDDHTISDGTSLQTAITTLNNYSQVFAVGVNCVSPLLVTPALDEIGKYTTKPLVAYPNLGSAYNPQIKQWEDIHQHFDFTQLAQEWYDHGGRLIGGCCTTGPQQIKEVAAFYSTLK